MHRPRGRSTGRVRNVSQQTRTAAMRRVGIKDVAAQAGVSMSSVSNALNRPERVSDEHRPAGARGRRRARLRAAAGGAAAARRAQRTARHDRHQHRQPLLRATGQREQRMPPRPQACASSSATATMTSRRSASHLRALRARAGRRRAGLAVRHRSASGSQRLLARGIPVVLVDRVDDDGRARSVSFDDVAGGRLAAEHLISTRPDAARLPRRARRGAAGARAAAGRPRRRSRLTPA